MTGDKKVFISGAGAVYNATTSCTALRDGKTHATREGNRTHRVDKMPLSAVPEGQAPCMRCWPTRTDWDDWSYLEHQIIRGKATPSEFEFFTTVILRLPGLRPS
jgi:hypothetical protein